MEFVNTILQQLGGKHFTAMTGSKNFICANVSETVTNPWLRMDLTRNRAGTNRLKITLDLATDTYIMEFYLLRIVKGDAKISKQKIFTGVYCDMLAGIFREVTGLYTSL